LAETIKYYAMPSRKCILTTNIIEGNHNIVADASDKLCQLLTTFNAYCLT